MIAALLMAAILGGAERIVAIQVHGNTLTSDDEIRRMAGLEVGDPIEEATIDEAAKRLRDTKQFESVQILKRFASIDDPSQVMIVVLVDEGPVHLERGGDPNAPVRAVRASGFHLMFLPVLNAEDGYGVTYGARFALPNPAGAQSRISFPLTWGGTKRAAAEFDKTLSKGPVDRVTAGAAASRRTNPFYEADDNRLRVWVRGERQIAKWFRAGATVGSQRVTFPAALGADRTANTVGDAGADATFDTRLDPMLPRNAVYARAAWEHIAGANRSDIDLRGYLGLVGQIVLQGRVQRSDADAPLPPFLKPLLGGMANLRGFKAGTAAGDTLVATSTELVVPLTSPLSFGRIGVTAFYDRATTYDKGQRLSDQTWKEGIGGSVWFSAAFVRLDIAVAHGRGSSTRVHVGANVSF